MRPSACANFLDVSAFIHLLPPDPSTSIRVGYWGQKRSTTHAAHDDFQPCSRQRHEPFKTWEERAQGGRTKTKNDDARTPESMKWGIVDRSLL